MIIWGKCPAPVCTPGPCHPRPCCTQNRMSDLQIPQSIPSVRVFRFASRALTLDRQHDPHKLVVLAVAMQGRGQRFCVFEGCCNMTKLISREFVPTAASGDPPCAAVQVGQGMLSEQSICAPVCGHCCCCCCCRPCSPSGCGWAPSCG
jgi:hypothetical protein